MEKMLFSAVVAAVCIPVCAQTADLFKPYKQTELRLPSVPLVLSDPYFSIWSPYDELTEGNTKHWTNDDKPLEGLVRVDGKVYRWMGSSQREVMETVVPMAEEAAWEAQYTREKPADGWQNLNFDDTSWKTGYGAFGTDNNQNIRTAWGEEHSDIWVRRTVTLTKAQTEGDLYVVYSHDDACEVYINGKQVGTGIMELVEGKKVRLNGD